MLKSAFSFRPQTAPKEIHPFSSRVSKRLSRPGASFPKPQVMESPMNSMLKEAPEAGQGRISPSVSSESRAAFPRMFSDSLTTRSECSPSSPENRSREFSPSCRSQRPPSDSLSSETSPIIGRSSGASGGNGIRSGRARNTARREAPRKRTEKPEQVQLKKSAFRSSWKRVLP